VRRTPDLGKIPGRPPDPPGEPPGEIVEVDDAVPQIRPSPSFPSPPFLPCTTAPQYSFPRRFYTSAPLPLCAPALCVFHVFLYRRTAKPLPCSSDPSRPALSCSFELPNSRTIEQPNRSFARSPRRPELHGSDCGRPLQGVRVISTLARAFPASSAGSVAPPAIVGGLYSTGTR